MSDVDTAEHMVAVLDAINDLDWYNRRDFALELNYNLEKIGSPYRFECAGDGEGTKVVLSRAGIATDGKPVPPFDYLCPKCGEYGLPSVRGGFCTTCANQDYYRGLPLSHGEPTFTEAWERLRDEIYRNLRIPQIADWLERLLRT